MHTEREARNHRLAAASPPAQETSGRRTLRPSVRLQPGTFSIRLVFSGGGSVLTWSLASLRPSARSSSATTRAPALPGMLSGRAAPRTRERERNVLPADRFHRAVRSVPTTQNGVFGRNFCKRFWGPMSLRAMPTCPCQKRSSAPLYARERAPG